MADVPVHSIRVMKSPIRFVGGKGWLVNALIKEIERVSPKRYFEPFVGGASIALNVPSYIPKILSDSNNIVMDLWRCLRDMPEAVIDELARVEKQYPNTAEGYLKARDELNSMILSPRLKWTRRSAIFLYINARSFNGIWRTNSSGYYNVPYGKINSPSSIDREEAVLLSRALKGAELHTDDYWSVLWKHRAALKDALIYADPPYDGTYDGYTADGFGETDQRELSERLRWCVSQGAKVIASNSGTDLVHEIYSWASVSSVDEWHSVGATGARRGSKSCVIIRGGF